MDEPDGVPSVASVRRAVGLEDEVGLQVARVVVGGVEVGDDPRRDAKAAQDCREKSERHITDTFPSVSFTSADNVAIHYLNCSASVMDTLYFYLPD